MVHDLRYAFRTLRKQPTFTLVAVLTLALGIGANTGIFSLLYQALLRPLPYPDADRLVFVWNTYPLMGLPQASVSIPDYLDRRQQAPAIEEATLFRQVSLNLADGSRPERLRGLAVTPSFFATFGIPPALGAPFTTAHATPGRDKVTVLTHGLWVSRFGTDPTIVGRQIRLNGEPHEVVGVMPASFELSTMDITLFVPFAFTPQQISDQERGNEFSAMVARLRRGATIEQLDAQMKIIVERNLERLPARRAFARTSGFGGYAVDLREQFVGDVRTPLYILQAAVILVLLIACANVANLLLMRATGRHRELAIRTSLGAGRWRLVRQLLAEGALLATTGAIAGLGVAVVGVRGLVALSPQAIPGVTGSTLQPAVLAFTLGLATATAVIFGLVPGLAVARGDTNELLKDDSARTSAGRGIGLTRSTLVVAETALALVLLVGAGLLVRSFERLQRVDPGFTSDNVATAHVALPQVRYPDAAARRAFWERLVTSLRGLPGVTAAGLASNIPLSGNVSSGSYSIVGYTPGPNEPMPHGRQEVVGGDYFAALRIPLVAGRFFSDADTATSLPVVVIDRYLVDRYFKNTDPIGRQIRRGGPDSFTIVGVAGTINSIDLGEPVSKERLYYPVTQVPLPMMALVVRTGGDPLALVPQIRAAVDAIDPEQPIYDVRTMDQWVARSLAGRRMPMALLALFGGVALMLAAIGTYGVLAYAVTQRVREFGIRQALGADRRAILALVLGQGLRRAAAGIVIGLAASLALTRYLGSLLFQVGDRDPLVIGLATALLVGVAVAACLVPARRATAIDPAAALRDA